MQEKILQIKYSINNREREKEEKKIIKRIFIMQSSPTVGHTFYGDRDINSSKE